MKRVVVFSALVAASAIYGGAARAADGTINFKGALIASPCKIDSASSALNVDFGTVSTSAFSEAGSVATAQAFQIKLTDCDTTTYKKAAIRFDGSSPASSPQVLSTANADLAIELLDATGNRLNIGDNSPFTDLTPETGDDKNDGSGTLDFRARYVALKAGTAMTAGDAAATASFTVSYQ